MELKNLKNGNELVDLFCTLAEIPSPSLKEEKLLKKYVPIVMKTIWNAVLTSIKIYT